MKKDNFKAPVVPVSASATRKVLRKDLNDLKKIGIRSTAKYYRCEHCC
jgi:hypothetical protein